MAIRASKKGPAALAAGPFAGRTGQGWPALAAPATSLRPFSSLPFPHRTRRSTFKLNATDLFYTMPLRGVAAYDSYVEGFRQCTNSRVATLSFSYRLGSDAVTPTCKRTGGAEDNKRRAG